MSASLEALNKAIGVVGSPTELAKRVGVSPQNIFNWKRRGVPAERVPAVVRATDGAVQAHELRPDLPELFPVPTDSVAAA
ncbi:helix-turn-helix domain-containing protein [Azotobacter chroococcum]|uniref:Helix-turn-helix domain-containing protein n=2 Tax=Azotobacter chroococcum TaxID=353 RepID=A0AA43ZB85_9GAMM|nr:helix-turn-helix domain-containing protein [Azotobacter chroococcum]